MRFRCRHTGCAMSVPNVRIHITLPASFLKKVDEEARRRLLTRSVFIRLALMNEMQITDVIEPAVKYDKYSSTDEEIEAHVQQYRQILKRYG